jgi:hypothetical protein
MGQTKDTRAREQKEEEEGERERERESRGWSERERVTCRNPCSSFLKFPVDNMSFF